MIGIQKGTIILTTTHILYSYMSPLGNWQTLGFLADWPRRLQTPHDSYGGYLNPA